MRALSERSLTGGIGLLIAVGLAFRVALLLWADGAMVDDAYITIRCAQHLAFGEGLVYNVGERVLCVSTPLYAAWVAALLRLVPPGTIGYAIGAANIACFGLAAWWLARLLREFGRWVTLLAVAIFATYLPFVDNSTIGMETPLFLLGIVASLHLLRTHRLGWLSLVLGLLMLVRPEGVLWALCVLLGARVLRAPLRPRAILPGLAVVVAWLAFSVWYYGSPIPQSVVAKTGWVAPLYSRGGVAWIVATVRSLSLLELPPGLARALPGGRVLEGAFVALSLGVFGVGSWRLVRTRSALLPLPFLYVSYVAFYMAARGRTDFSWYGVPSGLAFWVVVSAGAAFVASWAVGRRARERLSRAALPAVAMLLVAAGVVHWRADRMPYYRIIVTSYAEAGEFVRDHAADDSVVLVDEAGMIAWRAGGTVHDFAGLTSRRMLELQRAAGWPPDAVHLLQEWRPDLVVVSSIAHDLLLDADSEWVGARYEVAAEFPFHVVLERRPGLPGERPRSRSGG